MSTTKLNFVDHLICNFDRALRSLSPNTQAADRAQPQAETQGDVLTEDQRRHSAGLMRVNHAGEICAQALYQGQAMTAKLPLVRDEMDRAADEEMDHLAWCEQRLAELDSRPSLLNPLWYSLSFTLGAGAGLISDRVSLGFVAATEELVCEHLQQHLQALPPNDLASRAILEQMIIDEKGHGESALDAGGLAFPSPVKSLMSEMSKLMTYTSYRL